MKSRFAEIGGLESSPRLKSLRLAAWKLFESLPWPARTDEEWKRTDPAKIPWAEMDLQAVTASCTVGWEPPSPNWFRKGVVLTNLRTALRQFPEIIEEHLFQSGSPEGLAKFVALHQALWSEGLFCYVPEGMRVDIPLRGWGKRTQQKGIFFPHTLVVVDKGAEVTLIQELQPGGPAAPPAISNEMVEIFVKAGATLKYIRLQRLDRRVTELLTQRAVLEQDAQFLNVIVGLGGRLTKGNVETILKGPGGQSELMGVFFGSGDQHFDLHTLQDHRARKTTSNLLYKSALADQAQAVYTGLIRIGKEAEKSDAYQANRNLLLSQGAGADSVPMLEIETNDVRCTHGVAVGPVEEEQALYLMSRGLSRKEAEHLIVEGFFEPVFQRIPLETLREQLTTEVNGRQWQSG